MLLNNEFRKQAYFFPMDYLKKSLKKKYENFIKGKFDFRESPLG